MTSKTNDRPLAGKTALVTGGSRGIGAAIVRRLARDGARVVFTYAKNAEKADAIVAEIKAAGGSALALQADAAEAADVEKAVETTVSATGSLDILVNNAGVGNFAPLADYALADFDRTFDVNVRSVFIATKVAARHMRPGSTVVTIGSINADRMPFAGGSVYAASKAAVAGLTRGLARDLGAQGITVNNIQPGPVDTDMNPADGPFAQALKSLMALPRYGHGDEIAGMVAYLAGPEARFVTGASLTIDGGFGA